MQLTKPAPEVGNCSDYAKCGKISCSTQIPVVDPCANGACNQPVEITYPAPEPEATETKSCEQICGYVFKPSEDGDPSLDTHIDICYDECVPAEFTCLMSVADMEQTDCANMFQDQQMWCSDREEIMWHLNEAGLAGLADWLDSDRDGTWDAQCDQVMQEEVTNEPEDEWTEDATIEKPMEPVKSRPNNQQRKEKCSLEFTDDECTFSECTPSKEEAGDEMKDCWKETCANECAESCLLWFMGDYNTETEDWDWHSKECPEHFGQ